VRWSDHFGWLIASIVVWGGTAKAESGVAPAVAPTLRSPAPAPAPAMVRLIPNEIVDVGRSATLVVNWRFGPAEECSLKFRTQFGDAEYCVELDTRVLPHRCVVTTSRVLRHVVLGEAIQRCFRQSQVVANK
jgi:hypothetical protein